MTQRRPTSATRAFGAWLGWPGWVMLVLVVCGVGYGLLWERNRNAPLPPGASAVTVNSMPNIRQTAYAYNGTPEQLGAFYEQELAARGWRRCGDGATPGCSNLPQLVGRDPRVVTVYRRADAPGVSGPTVEIWPIERDGSLYVTVFETRGE